MRGAVRTLDLCRGKYFGAILKNAATGDHVSSRHRHGVIDVAVLEIELTLPQVWIRVPTANIVVHRHPWVPLSDLVQCAVASHAIGAVLRDKKRVLHSDGDGAAVWKQGRVEIDAHHGVIRLSSDAAPIHLKAGDVVATLKPAHTPA